jgi:uncharacterized protein (DUF427 family)
MGRGVGIVRHSMAMESVWDYPRPPRLEATAKHLRIVTGGVVVADTRRAHRVLETSHPPVYYFPLEDVTAGILAPSRSRGSVCEWKGPASYYDVVVGGRTIERAAWAYHAPSAGFEPIRDAVAFYPAAMGDCTVDGEPVSPQPGGFYGGWITGDLVGPFKGAPGTAGW